MVTETPEILGQYNCSQVAYISLDSCIFIVISVVLWSRVMINLIPPLCLLALFDLASSTTVSFISILLNLSFQVKYHIIQMIEFYTVAEYIV